MMNWQDGDVDVNGLRLHYTRTGGGDDKPFVVLAHGFSDDGLCWAPVAHALAPDYHVVMLDARGHGRSAAPETGYGPVEQAADLAGAISALGLHRPAILGHSMGAATTLVLAGTYPDVPRAILLEDPPQQWLPATPENEAAREQRGAGMRAWVAGLKGKTRDELIAAQRAQTPGWSEAELGPWADSKLRLGPSVLNVPNRNGATPVDWPATLRRIACPALLITGDPERGAIVTDAGATSLRALVPRVRVAHIAGAGHSIRRDRFDEYLKVVQAFLADSAAGEQQ